MAAAVRLGVRHLAAQIGAKPLHLIGYSTGAALALDFALDARVGEATPLPTSLVLISPALGIHPSAALAGVKSTLGSIPGMRGLAWLQIAPEFDPYKYNSFATNAGSQVHRLTRSVSRRIPNERRQPSGLPLPRILVFKSAVDATVSTDAVVDRLLGRLAPHRHELVLFDINRVAINSSLLISDPGPITRRLMEATDLPFSVRLITNEAPDTWGIVAHYKPPLSRDIARSEPLPLEWPRGLISLSHVALPFPPDDPLYGRQAPEDRDTLFLGEMALRGERDLLRFPESWLLRLRYNPFYEYLEERTAEWLEKGTENE